MEIIELLLDLLTAIVEGISSKMGWIFIILFVMVVFALVAYTVMLVAGE